ncbi:MAG: DUF4190 domain-containing protein [Planctomycetes bacterium]|nr:DUF4190 domain-containing protein [Planctomycetota bacterium]
MALLVRCPKCGETKEYPETIVGHALRCPGCDLRFLVAGKPDRGNYAVVRPVSGRVRGGDDIPLGPRTSVLAAASLVLGIAGPLALGVVGAACLVLGILSMPACLWMCNPGVAGVAGLVLGILGLRRIGTDRNLGGRGLAKAGIALSAVSVVLGLTIVVAGERIWWALTEPPADATSRMFSQLDAALQRYSDDWGRFPWTADTPDGLMGAADPKKGLRPAAGTDDDAAALLFAALNLRQKRGPYIANAGMRILEKGSGGASYRVYCDGWGRPIRYGPPEGDGKKPLLESEGADPDDQYDNLTNE